MTRTSFIKSILAAAGVSVLPKEWLTVYDKFYLLQCFAAGFQYHEGIKFLDQLKEGDVLRMKREPKNPHDENAIALYWKEHQIGFIPADLNEILSRLIDAEALELHSEITHVKSVAASWENVHVAVYFLKPRIIGTEIPKQGDYLRKLETPTYYTVSNSKNEVTYIENNEKSKRIALNTNMLPERFSSLKEKYNSNKIIRDKNQIEEKGFHLLDDFDIDKIISEIELAVEKIDATGKKFIEVVLKK